MDVFRRLGHRVIELERCVAGIAEQPGFFRAQRKRLGHHLGVIGGAAILTAADEGSPRLFAQVAARRIAGEGLVDRTRQGDGEETLLPACLRGLRHCVAQEAGKAVDVAFLQKEHPILFVGEQVLAEFRAERRQLLIDGREALLAFRIEFRARADESLPCPFQDPQRLGIEPEAGAALVEVVNAGEQCRVHRNRGEMPRHFRRDFALHRLNGVIGMGARPAPEYRRDAGQRLAAEFQRLQRIVDGGGLRVAGHSRDFGLMRRQCRVEYRAEIAVGDP